MDVKFSLLFGIRYRNRCLKIFKRKKENLFIILKLFNLKRDNSVSVFQMVPPIFEYWIGIQMRLINKYKIIYLLRKNNKSQSVLHCLFFGKK
ncbi:hypothetical protein BpHYR1_019190 [Brachionus plicatilis]|uniref:Uncharacterized protein n=1 Tax=Brachionus plicatilis TaxID=10195 RepID=A0A3M7QX82_BRAPC|nr:hypothetical protein BpHYR1_019190 [Brachionus plicatilis]